jgi:hypothetical protein
VAEAVLPLVAETVEAALPLLLKTGCIPIKPAIAGRLTRTCSSPTACA